MRRSAALSFLVCSGVAVFALSDPGGERTVKLNDTLALRPAGDVSDYELTADSTRTVFLAEGEGGEVVLLSAPLDGSSAQVQLNAPLVDGGTVTEFQLTPDGARAVYRADQDVDNQYELYSVPFDGSQPPTKLSGNLLEDRDVRGIFRLSPDGSLAVYRADANADQRNELFSVPVDGSAAPVRLNSALGSSQALQPDFVLTPDGISVVYHTDTLGTHELFSARLDGVGGAAPLGETGSFDSMQVSPDSTRVVYRSTGDFAGVFELYSVPVDGSAAAVKLNGLLPGGGDVFDFGISPDSTLVVYTADQDIDTVNELFSVPIDGSAPEIKLNTPLAAGTAIGVGPFRIAPDGSRVAFWAIQDLVVRQALFSVPLDGSAAAIQLTGNAVYEDDFEVSIDSSRLLYRRNDNGDRLFSVPLDGSAAPLEIGASTAVLGFWLAPAGGQVVYERGFYALYSVPFDGSAAATLLVDFTAVFVPSVPEEVQVTPDGLQVVYRADQDVDEVLQLYSVPVDGSQAPLGVTEPLFATPAGRVLGHQVSPDSQWVVYWAWGDVPAALELYSLPSDRSLPPVKLNTSVVPNGDIFRFTITPDSQRVVYQGDQDEDEVYELYSAPIDGSQPAIKLNDPLGPDGDVGLGFSTAGVFYLVSPDSQRVVYVADQESDGTFDLYSVPIDRSQAPVKLNGTFLSTGFPGYRITPDSSRVVYVGDQDQPDQNKLYSVPIDGSATPLELASPAIPDGDVGSFQISPDGSQVVFRGDLELSSQPEIFAVPVDGSSAPTKLSGTLPNNGEAGSYRISADSTRVVYVAERTAALQQALYSVRLDGSDRIRLSSDPPSQSYVGITFEVLPDSTGVVYSANLRVSALFELFHAPIDAPGGQVRISGDLIEFGEIRSWQLSPDGSRVVYNADAEQNTWWRLYSVPATGGAVTRINGPLIFPGDVQPTFQFSPDSSYVLYEADQEVNGLLEIYAVPLDGRTEAPFSLKAHPDFPQRDVLNAGISPDSSRVLFISDRDMLHTFELYATDLVPRVTGVSPALGPSAGGNTVTLTGCGFTPDAEVTIGGKPATEVTYVSASELRVTAPANRSLPSPPTGPPSGRLRRAVIPRLTVDVEVSVAGIGSTLAAGYTYVPGARR